MLACRHFPNAHNQDNVAELLNEMITEWSITRDKQGILVRDGGTNMVAGARLLDFKSAHCYLHILHLIVTDGLAQQVAVLNICKKGRDIATHCNHSQNARTRLKNIQVLILCIYGVTRSKKLQAAIFYRFT